LKKVLKDEIDYHGPQRNQIREELKDLKQVIADVLAALPLEDPEG